MIDLPTTLHAPPPVWTPRFDVPAAVTAIDLEEADPVAGDRLSTQARMVVPGITDAQVAELVAARRTVVESLRAGGVFWAGSCIARGEADPGRLTVAHLAALLVDVETTIETDELDLAAVAAELAAGAGPLTPRGPNDDSRRVSDVIRLPAGPAILVISEQTVSDGLPGGAGRVVRQVLVALPVPCAPKLAVLTLATEYLEDWPAYLDLMATIARSLRFSC